MFTERFNALLTEVCRTTTGEFAEITRYDRSYVSHLRNGDRIPKPGHAAAERLARAVYICAAEKNALDSLCRRIGTTSKAGDEEICAAIGAWLFDTPNAAAKRHPETAHAQREPRSVNSFGNRLGLAMELANVSAVRLARALNVDASLVSKYRSGLRVPRVNHPIIHDIGTALAARIYSLDRIAGLSRLVGMPQAELPDEKTGAQRLEAWLRDFRTVDTSLIERFLEGMDAFPQNSKQPLLSVEDAVDEAALAERAEVYEGTEGLRSAVLRFLGSAVKNGQRELYLYSDQSIDWMISDKTFFLRWASLMSAYVRGGGKICIVHNVDRGLEEMISAIRSWLPLYLSGGIESYYCLRHGGERFSHTLFLAPGSACIFGTHVASRETHTRYRYLTDAAELAYYRAAFDDLLSDCRQLMTISRDGSAAKLPAVMKDKTVHRVARSFSLGTMPEGLLRGILERAALPRETADRILADWASKRELLEEMLTGSDIFECVSLPEETALFEGNVAVDTAHAALFYTPEEYGAHVRGVLELSEQNPNYRIFPLEEPPFERTNLVASGRAAVIECLPGRAITFTTPHPLMCRAFVDFAVRLEDQYGVDRLTLKNKLKRYI